MLANQPQWFIKLRTASSICINNEVDRQRHLQLTADVDHAAQGKSGRGSWLMVVVVMLWCSLTAVVLQAGQSKPGRLLCCCTANVLHAAHSKSRRDSWLTAAIVMLLCAGGGVMLVPSTKLPASVATWQQSVSGKSCCAKHIIWSEDQY